VVSVSVVFLCVGHSGEPCKTAEPIEMPFQADSCGSREPRISSDAHWRHLAMDPRGDGDASIATITVATSSDDQ